MNALRDMIDSYLQRQKITGRSAIRRFDDPIDVRCTNAS